MRWPFRRRTRPDGGSRGRIVVPSARRAGGTPALPPDRRPDGPVGPVPRNIVPAGTVPEPVVTRDLPRRDWARLAVLRPVARPRDTVVTVRPPVVAAERSLLTPLRHRAPMPARPVGRVRGVATPSARAVAAALPSGHRVPAQPTVVSPAAAPGTATAGAPSPRGPVPPTAATAGQPVTRPDPADHDPAYAAPAVSDVAVSDVAVPDVVVSDVATEDVAVPDVTDPAPAADVAEPDAPVMAEFELPVPAVRRLAAVVPSPPAPVLTRVTDDFVDEPLAPDDGFRSVSEFDRLLAQYEAMPIELLAMGAIGGSVAAPPPSNPTPPSPPRPAPAPADGPPRRRSLAESRRRGLTAPPRTPAGGVPDAGPAEDDGGAPAQAAAMPSIEMLRAMGIDVVVEDEGDTAAGDTEVAGDAGDGTDDRDVAPAPAPDERERGGDPDAADAPDDDGGWSPPPGPVRPPSSAAATGPTVPPLAGPTVSGPIRASAPRVAAEPSSSDAPMAAPDPGVRAEPPSGPALAAGAPRSVPVVTTPMAVARATPVAPRSPLPVGTAPPELPVLATAPTLLLDRPSAARTAGGRRAPAITRLATIRPGAAPAPAGPSVLPRSVVTVPVDLAVALETRWGLVVHDVPVYRGAAADLVHGVDARAVAHRGRVYLPDAAGDLATPSTRALLAHELVHVAQQRSLRGALPGEASPVGRSLEAQARAVEAWVLFAGGGVGSAPATPVAPPPLTPPVPDEAGAVPPSLLLRPSPASLLDERSTARSDRSTASPDPSSPTEGPPEMTVAPDTPPAAESWSIEEGFGPGASSDLVGLQRAPHDVVDATEVPAARDHAAEITALTEEVEELRTQVAALASRLAAVDDDLRSPTGLSRLAARLYRPLRGHLRAELLIDRERSGRLADLQMRGTR